MTTREPLFTEQDRAELLALGVYRAGLCPVCGGPLEECTSHEATGPRFSASPLMCRRTEALLIAQEAKQTIQRPGALVWTTTAKRR